MTDGDERIKAHFDETAPAGTVLPKLAVGTRRINPRTAWTVVLLLAVAAAFFIVNPTEHVHWGAGPTPTPSALPPMTGLSLGATPPVVGYPSVVPSAPPRRRDFSNSASEGPNATGTSLTPQQQAALRDKVQRDVTAMQTMSTVAPSYRTGGFTVPPAAPLPPPTTLPDQSTSAIPANPNPGREPIYVVQGVTPTLTQLGDPQMAPGEEGAGAWASPGPGGAGLPATYGEDRQNSELRFLARNAGAAYLNADELPPYAKCEVFAGSTLHLRLISAINTSLPGYAWAEFTQPVRSSLPPYNAIFPAFTRVRGEYNAALQSGDTRVQVRWDLIILPNGYTFNLAGMQGADPTGETGLTGDVNDHKGRIITSLFIGTILDAGAAVAAPSSVLLTPNFSQSVASSAATNASNYANQVVSRNLSMPPTIVVPENKDFIITLESTLVNLRPYDDLRETP